MILSGLTQQKPTLNISLSLKINIFYKVWRWQPRTAEKSDFQLGKNKLCKNVKIIKRFRWDCIAAVSINFKQVSHKMRTSVIFKMNVLRKENQSVKHLGVMHKHEKCVIHNSIFSQMWRKKTDFPCIGQLLMKYF